MCRASKHCMSCRRSSIDTSANGESFVSSHEAICDPILENGAYDAISGF